MKIIKITLLNLSITSLSLASTDSCLTASRIYLNGINIEPPPQECLTIISNEPTAKEFISKLNSRVIAYKEMAYIISDANTQLLAGNQTKLTNPVFVNMSEESNSLIIAQNEEEGFSYSFFHLNLIGNVTPRYYYLNPSENPISEIHYLSESQELALVSSAAKKIEFINLEADSRYKNENKKHELKIKRSIAGDLAELENPKIVTESALKKEIYVLDNNRVLVFDHNPQGNEAPLRVISSSGLENITSMKLNSFENELLMYEGGVLKKSVYIDP